VINVGAPQSSVNSTGNKRKRTTSNTGSRKRRNEASAPTSNTPAAPSIFPTNPASAVPHASGTSSFHPPAIPGAGPTVGEEIAATLHPIFTRSDGPSTARTGHSLIDNLDSSKGNTQVASDVWYFIRPLHSKTKPETLPETEALHYERPNPKDFAFVGCRLCT
jgi:hypothetical protein